MVQVLREQGSLWQFGMVVLQHSQTLQRLTSTERQKELLSQSQSQEEMFDSTQWSPQGFGQSRSEHE